MMIITEYMENGALDKFLRVRMRAAVGRDLWLVCLGVPWWAEGLCPGRRRMVNSACCSSWACCGALQLA